MYDTSETIQSQRLFDLDAPKVLQGLSLTHVRIKESISNGFSIKLRGISHEIIDDSDSTIDFCLNGPLGSQDFIQEVIWK